MELWGDIVVVYGGEGLGKEADNSSTVQLLGDIWALDLRKALDETYDEVCGQASSYLPERFKI